MEEERKGQRRDRKGMKGNNRGRLERGRGKGRKRVRYWNTMSDNSNSTAMINTRAVLDSMSGML